VKIWTSFRTHAETILMTVTAECNDERCSATKMRPFGVETRQCESTSASALPAMQKGRRGDLYDGSSKRVAPCTCQL